MKYICFKWDECICQVQTMSENVSVFVFVFFLCGILVHSRTKSYPQYLQIVNYPSIPDILLLLSNFLLCRRIVMQVGIK